jgi:hypothetical protein
MPGKNFPANENEKTKEGLQLDALIESLAEDALIKTDLMAWSMLWKINGKQKNQLELLLIKQMAFLKIIDILII